MRWLRQRDKYNCGPIALINLAKWRGESVTGRDLPHYQKLCKCEPVLGTKVSCLRPVIGLPKRGSYHKLKQHLFSGGTAIVLARKHYFFVRGIADCTDGRRGFLAINCYEGETVSLLSWQRMSALLRHGWTWFFDANV